MWSSEPILELMVLQASFEGESKLGLQLNQAHRRCQCLLSDRFHREATRCDLRGGGGLS